MVKKIFHLFAIWIICIPIVVAQSSDQQIFKFLEGNWEGAFIKNNSYQKLDIQFYKKDSIVMSLQIIEEWHPQFGEFELPVEIDSMGYIQFNTGHGRAKVQLDSSALEMNGLLENSNPAIYVHFKKVPNLPKPRYEAIPLTIKHADISLYGHLHQPLYATSKTAIIIVGGRGCYAGSTKYDLYAKLLRQYGVSVFSYHKRGTGKSTGDCMSATIDDLAQDLATIKNHLHQNYDNLEHIGVIGSSAGGWVMMKAAEYAAFDFHIGIVGPSTSVREQQMQSLDYGIEQFNLSQKSKEELIAYTNLVFEAEVNQENFRQFQELLASADKNGWKNLLEDTDIPENAQDISNLWVRRHNYDPASALKQSNVPFLAIYGEKDWIVPYKENIERLNQCFKGDRTNLLSTIVVPDAGHGTDVQEGYEELPNGNTYWKFFRISPYVQIELIRFLEANKFLD